MNQTKVNQTEWVQTLADILHLELCCHSNETHALIANLPNSAQLDSTLTIPPNYIWVRAVVWECSEGQTDNTKMAVINVPFASATPQMQNVIKSIQKCKLNQTNYCPESEAVMTLTTHSLQYSIIYFHVHMTKWSISHYQPMPGWCRWVRSLAQSFARTRQLLTCMTTRCNAERLQ